jgi:signal transduction histidine kinase
MDTTAIGVSSDASLRAHIRQLEDALAVAEETLVEALALTRSWSFETDERLRLTRVRGRIDEILGAKPGDGIGRSLESLHTDPDDPVVQEITACLRRRAPYSDKVFRMPTRRGPRWIKGSAIPFRRGDGGFGGYRGTCCDVTAEVEAERRAADANRYFLDAINRLDLSISVFDAGARLVACNRRFFELLDLPPELGRSGTRHEDVIRYQAIRGDFGPGDVEAIVADRRLSAHRPIPRTFERTRADGVVLEINGRPTPDGGIVITHADITERRQREREIETSNAQIRRFVDAIERIPVSISLYDADDRLVMCNRMAREAAPWVGELLVPGVTYREMTKAHLDRARIPEAFGREEEWLEERMRKHRAGDEFIREYSNGEWFKIVERPTADGGVIHIRTDVTELKQHERELARRAAEVQAYAKELERSNAELEQFAYVASHDLQEPLRMVASYCQLLQRRYKGKLDADADDFIGYAVEGATRMQRLIADLLNYSRVGRRGKPPQPLPARKLVEDALDNLRGAILEAEAQIEIGELPVVLCERTQLTQLFQNLIGNAIKFRREVPVRIRVEAAREGDFWRFTVADNGIGIQSEYLDRIFLIFQRLHERDKYPGTGIGLAIAKKVVEHHGGRIWIDSVPGQGSRFHFTLPASETTETK